jgi:hypothetical protein
MSFDTVKAGLLHGVRDGFGVTARVGRNAKRPVAGHFPVARETSAAVIRVAPSVVCTAKTGHADHHDDYRNRPFYGSFLRLGLHKS